MAELYAGFARARLGPAAAFIDVHRGTVAACEENRLTRARQAATQGAPELATAELLAFLQRARVGHRRGRRRHQRGSGQLGGRGAATAGLTTVQVDGHDAHATYAFHSSGFTEALVLVCEVHKPRGWTAWHFAPGESARPVGERIGDFPLAQIYSQLTIALGFQQTRDEHVVEAMARAGRDTQGRIADLVQLTPGGVRVDPSFSAEIEAALRTGDPDATRRDIAASMQRRLGECLTQLLRSLADLQSGPTRLCVSGGLFFNTYFTTIAASSGAFADVHVPPHPGPERNGCRAPRSSRAPRRLRGDGRDRRSGTGVLRRADQGSARELQAVVRPVPRGPPDGRVLHVARHADGSSAGFTGGWSGGRARSAIARCSRIPSRRTRSTI